MTTPGGGTKPTPLGGKNPPGGSVPDGSSANVGNNGGNDAAERKKERSKSMGAKGDGKPIQKPTKTEKPPTAKVGEETKRPLTKSVPFPMSFLEAAKKASATTECMRSRQS